MAAIARYLGYLLLVAAGMSAGVVTAVDPKTAEMAHEAGRYLYGQGLLYAVALFVACLLGSVLVQAGLVKKPKS